MWKLETDWYELVLRSACVFVFLFITFRIWGKKHFAQITPFDLVLLLIISEAVQNAIVGDDKSVPGGLITVGTMMLLNVVLNRLAYHYYRIEKIVQGVPKILIKNGQVDEVMMKRETITEQELHEALRKQGVIEIDDVGLATIETNGEISIIKKEDLSMH